MAKKGSKVTTHLRGNDLIAGAVQDGVETIIEKHPRFKGREKYIQGYLSQKNVTHALSEINYEIGQIEAQKGPLPETEKAQMIYDSLSAYVARGDAFDDDGKEVILKGSLEEKAGKWHGFKARRQLGKERSLERTMGAFSDLYHLLKSGDYAERMPEVARDVNSIYDGGFLDTALDFLKHYGLMTSKRYNMLKSSLRKGIEKAGERARGSVEHYVHAYNAATAVFLILGAGLIIFSSGEITGNVVGSSLNSSYGVIVGVLLMIVGYFIYTNKPR